MDTTSDSARFNDLAVGSSGQAAPATPPATTGHVAKAPERADQPAGEFVQFAKIGNGWAPVQQTYPQMPAGVYHMEYNGQQWVFVAQPLVTDSLLRLPDTRSDFVISEIESFWPRKAEFTRLGYTHKRGFLLYGPPGSGKTCTVSIITKQMVERGNLVFLANLDPDVVVMMLGRFRQANPDRQAVVVIEDIDAYIKRHGEAQVLSILDGENSINNVVYLATTNYPENLDARVINRPSRFDRVIHIDTPSPAARGLYLKSRGVLADQDIERWVSLTDGFSIAHLKELLIGVFIFGGELEAEVRRLDGMKKTPKSSDGKQGVGFGRS